MADETTCKKKRARWLKPLLMGLAAVVLVGFALQCIVVAHGNTFILDLERDGDEIVSGLPEGKTDCILVLGAALWDGVPCPMLEERLDEGAALYHAGASDTVIVSGAVDGPYYNEPQAMEDYLVEYCGVPREAILQDPKGFNTYDSMYQAKYTFGMESVLIATERYHLFRACYIADALGLRAYGADACAQMYFGNVNREVRECIARVKDFFLCLAPSKAT